MCALYLGPISIKNYLATGQIEQVICGGENYEGAKPCVVAWVESLQVECVAGDVTFAFIETGSQFIKDGKTYQIPRKRVQARMAYKSGMGYQGCPMEVNFTDRVGLSLDKSEFYQPQFGPGCQDCGLKLIYNGYVPGECY